jgi:hypothetical protein
MYANGLFTAGFLTEILNTFLISAIEHIPFWEANSHSASQEIPRLLFNLKVLFYVHTINSCCGLLWSR